MMLALCCGRGSVNVKLGVSLNSIQCGSCAHRISKSIVRESIHAFFCYVYVVHSITMSLLD